MALVDLLVELKATDWDGVEGLVALHVAAALGLRARLESSGSQRGRDGAFYDLQTGNPAHIDLEVKRYRPGNHPSPRMLLGELTQTRRARPATKLWILACTYAVSAATVDELQDEAFRSGFDVVVLDSGEGSIGPLDLLLAFRENVTLDWVERNYPSARSIWSKALAEVRAHPSYAVQVATIDELLRGRHSPGVAHQAARQWLIALVENRKSRQAGLNQALGRSDRAPSVDRPRLKLQWEDWLQRETHDASMLALLGLEGDGKTWTAVDILLEGKDYLPLVATSNLFDDGGAESLIAKLLARQCGGDEDRWRNILLKHNASWPRDKPLLLLIDGLNEAPSKRMDSVLADLLSAALAIRIKVVVTCRTPFWERSVEPLLERHRAQIQRLEVGPFERETEWPSARRLLGAGAERLPWSVLEALRNPRLWSFAYDLRDRLGGLSEITLEHLLVEHWRMRIAQRDDISVNPSAFSRLIAQCAESLLDDTAGTAAWELGELKTALARLVGSTDRLDAAIGEIRDGQYFHSTLNDQIQLRRDRVPAALGILLADRLLRAAECEDPRLGVGRAAAAFLYDLPASDRVELIVRTAVFALLARRQTQTLVPILLRHWVTLQNTTGDHFRAVSIAVAAAPAEAIRAIEDEASHDEFVAEAIGDLISALLSRRTRLNVRVVLKEACERWFGSFSMGSHRALTGAHPRLVQSPFDWVETLDDHAGAILAHLPINDWIDALVLWTIRRSVLDERRPESYRYDDQLCWLALTNETTHAEVADLLDRVKSRLNDLGWSDAKPLNALLNGDLFELGGRRYTQELSEPIEQENCTSVPPEMAGDLPGFKSIYADDSAATSEQWLSLERRVIDYDATLLAPFVGQLADEAFEVISGKENCGFGQFARDHCLLLGRNLLPALFEYASGAAEQGAAGFALAAIGVAVSDESLVPTMLAITNLDAFKIDTSTFIARLSGDDEELITVALTEQSSATLFRLLLCGRTGIALGQRLEKSLLDAVFTGVGEARQAALAVLAARGDQLTATAIAESSLTAADVVGASAGDDLSRLIVAGTDSPDYFALRRRVSALLLGEAAKIDGRPEAVRQLARDFDAIIAAQVEGGIEGLNPAVDFVSLAAARVRRHEDSGAMSSAGNDLQLTAAGTASVLALFADLAPDEIVRLRSVIDKLSPGALGNVENATRLVTVLAERSSPEVQLRWILELHSHDLRLTNFGSLNVSRHLLFAFRSQSQACHTVRDALADLAWTDDALLDIVCLAEIGGWNEWLTNWIDREETSGALARQARAVILRGWRAAEADVSHLCCVDRRNGFDRFFIDIALARSHRRVTMREHLRAFACASTDEEAWLAYRKLLSITDRRLEVEVAAPGWREALTGRRHAYHAVMSSDFEWLYRRNEGDLSRTFSGIVHPVAMGPWAIAPLYDGDSSLVDA